MYALTTDNKITKYPYGLGDLKKDHPITSFPSTFAEFDYASYGVVEVTPKDLPTYDPDTQRVVEGTPALKNGIWEQVWKIEPLSAEEQQQVLDNKASSVRAQRDKLLEECDWTQSRDVTLENDSEWVTYRQALRDITLQEGFPHEVVWPTKP